jgi:hypothetical protein
LAYDMSWARMTEAEIRFSEWLSKRASLWWRTAGTLVLLGALGGCGAVLLIPGIEAFIWLRTGKWPGWSLRTLLALGPSGGLLSRSDPSSWIGLHRLVQGLLDGPLWIWMSVFTFPLVKLLDFFEDPIRTWEVLTVMRSHALLINGRLEQFDGTLDEAEKVINKYTSNGDKAVYLFGADSDEQFAKKWEEEKRRTAPDSY